MSRPASRTPALRGSDNVRVIARLTPEQVVVPECGWPLTRMAR